MQLGAHYDDVGKPIPTRQEADLDAHEGPPGPVVDYPEHNEIIDRVEKTLMRNDRRAREQRGG